MGQSLFGRGCGDDAEGCQWVTLWRLEAGSADFLGRGVESLYKRRFLRGFCRRSARFADAGEGCRLPAARKRHQPGRSGGDQGSDSAGDLGRGETAIYPEGIKLAGVRNVTAIKLDTNYVETPWGRKEIPALFPDGNGRQMSETGLEGTAGRHSPLLGNK